MRPWLSLLLLAFGLGFVCPSAGAAEPSGALTIAAAANLTFVLPALQAEFAKIAPGVSVKTAFGASGNLTAQIRNGAPFDVFLSADTDYPRRLIAAGAADAGSFTVFATGRLALWTTRRELALTDVAAVIRDPSVRRVAIANPQTAPFGRAAERLLETAGLGEIFAAKRVTGENIAQTAHFVETGNADVGFVALSIVLAAPAAHRGHWLELEPSRYAGVTLDEAAVLTVRGQRNPAARQFLAFLGSAPARRILRDAGYALPPAAAK